MQNEYATEYYENGNIMWEGWYLNDTRHGHWKFYYEEGGLRSEGQYINDTEEGFWKYYHPNGQIESEGHYVNGEKDDFWQSFDTKGEPYTDERLFLPVRLWTLCLVIACFLPQNFFWINFLLALVGIYTGYYSVFYIFMFSFRRGWLKNPKYKYAGILTWIYGLFYLVSLYKMRG